MTWCLFLFLFHEDADSLDKLHFLFDLSRQEIFFFYSCARNSWTTCKQVVHFSNERCSLSLLVLLLNHRIHSILEKCFYCHSHGDLTKPICQHWCLYFDSSLQTHVFSDILMMRISLEWGFYFQQINEHWSNEKVRILQHFKFASFPCACVLKLQSHIFNFPSTHASFLSLAG